MPTARSKRRSLHRAGLLALVLGTTAGGIAFAQSPGTPAPGVLDEIRPGTGNDTTNDLRPSQGVPTNTLSSGGGLSNGGGLTDGGAPSSYEPFSRGSEDPTDRPDQFDVPADGEDSDQPATAAPRFDLFEGPDGRPIPPGNLPAEPAAAAAGQNLSPNAPANPDAPAQTGPRDREGTAQGRDADGRPLDPLIAARNGGLPEAGLAPPSSRSPALGLDAIRGRQNLPITPLRGTIPIAESDPFAPVGIRAGTFVLYSTLDQSIGASSNLSNSADGESGIFSETSVAARLLSDWSEHEFELNALGSYRRNFAGELESEPRIAVDGRLQLDVDRLTTATLRGAYEYRQEDPIDLDAGDSLSDRPDISTFSAGAEVERQFGRLTAGIDTSVNRQTRSQPDLGLDVEQLDESYTTYTTALRAGYEISPAIKPFAEGSLGLRTFDDEVDLAGIERDSTIQALRTGLEFDLGEKFLGEIAAGYAWNVPDADQLDTTGSPTIDARIAWSPQRGTDLVFTAQTSFDPDTDNSGTSTLYEGGLALRHRLTHRTDLTASLSAAYRDSDIEADKESSYAAEAGFLYWLNRTLAFTGLVRHEALNGETAGDDYTAETIKLGLRLQR